MIGATAECTAITPDESAKMIEYNLAEVDQDTSIFTGSGDGVLGVELFLLEPECTRILVDGGLNFDTFDPQNCFNVDNFSFAADYDQIKIDSDALDSYLTYEGEETKLEFLDGMLQGVEEVFQENNSLQDKCADCLSEAPTKKVSKLDNDLCKESCLERVGLENSSPGFNGRECSAETSNMSSPSVSVLESTYDQYYPLHELMTVQELREAFRSMFGCETLVTDKQWLKHRLLFGLQNHAELNNGLNLLDCSATSPENAGSTIFSYSIESPRSTSGSFIGVSDDKNMPGDDHVKRKKLTCCDSLKTLSSEVSRTESGSVESDDIGGTLIGLKRSRKPTRRYIEESLEHKSRYNNKKCGISYKSSRDRILHVKSHKQHCQKESGVEELAQQEEIFNVACIQVPFGLPIEGRLKKNMPSLEHDFEEDKDNECLGSNENFDVDPFPAESQDDSSHGEYVTRNNTVKGMKPRKHHKSWTPPEVMKLIEGVSMYGVGRWTEIKRLLFPSTTHRTSVDLKDKWRNLLKASYTQLQSNREVEQGRRQAVHQVPRCILRRVRELAAVYPYPREAKSKVSCTTPVASPFPATSNNILMPLSTGVGG